MTSYSDPGAVQGNASGGSKGHDGSDRTVMRGVAYVVIISYVIISLLPMLSSGFYSDDLYNSTLKGQIELQKISFVSYLADAFKHWIMDNGRPLAVALFITSLMSYLLYNVTVYKLILLVMVIANVLALGRLVYVTTKDRYASYLSMMVIPLLFQFRLYHDPILSHYGLFQILTILILSSVLCFNRYVLSDNKIYLMSSVLLYNLALYVSEISAVLVSLFAIIMLNNASHENGKIRMKRLLPFIISVLVAISVMITAKLLKTDSTAGYSGIELSLNMTAIVKAMFVQLYATLPLSYYLSNPSHIFHINFSEFVGNISLVDLLGMIIFIGGYVYTVKNMHFLYDKYQVRALAAVGMLLMLCPAFMIALSAKYQQELYLGIGYLQVYIQYYGMVLIGIALLLYAQHKIDNGRIRCALHSCLAAVFSVTFMLNAQNNRLVIDKSNIDMHYRRSALIRSLSDNILDQLPENSIIFIKDEYYYDSFPQVRSDTRGWAEYGYSWKNAALVYMYSGKRMNVVTDLNELKKYAAGGNNSRVNNIYLLNIKSYPRDSGNREAFVILSSIYNLVQDKDGILHFGSQPLKTSFPRENG